MIFVDKEYDKPQLSLTSAFVKSSAVKDNNLKFDVKLKYAEDAKLATDIIMIKKAYGVLSRPVHYYRKRSTGDSAINTAQRNRSWYFDTPIRCYKYLLDKYSDENGYPGTYAQYLVLYDLQWRIGIQDATTLSADDIKKYKDVIFKIIKNLDDENIVGNSYLDVSVKLYMLNKKYNENYVSSKITNQGSVYYFNNMKLYDYSSCDPRLYIQKIDIN